MTELHVCILGAGALGQAYAVACGRGGARLSLVTRTQRAADHVQGQRLTFPKRHDNVPATWVTELPRDSDVILVCVRMDQIDEALLGQLSDAAGTRSVVIFVTPLLPEMLATVQAKLPHSQSAMPSLIAEFADSDSTDGHALGSHAAEGEVAYWVAPTATLFSADATTRPAVTRLIDALKRGGVPSRIQSELRAYADATTIAFFPIQLGFLREPEMRAWRGVPGLLPAIAHGLRRTLALAKQIGSGDRGLMLLMWLLSFTWLLSVVSALLPWIMPRFTAYLGNHFGEKLRAQHVALYEEVAQLGAARGIPQDYASLIVPVARQAR